MMLNNSDNATGNDIAKTVVAIYLDLYMLEGSKSYRMAVKNGEDSTIINVEAVD